MIIFSTVAFPQQLSMMTMVDTSNNALSEIVLVDQQTKRQNQRPEEAVKFSEIDDRVRSNNVPTKKKKSKSRNAPYPISILDRPALVSKLKELGIYGNSSAVQSKHLDSFYQILHRLHYQSATLQEFVTTYEQLNARVINYSTVSSGLPTKNSISKTKNPIKLQLPGVFLQFLGTSVDFCMMSSSVALSQTCADGSTTKLAIQLHDGQVVESVLMRYTNTKSTRASLCVSSQCGCAMGCTFCATGTMGLSGNLTTGEILEQIVHADRILAAEWFEASTVKTEFVRNVVFMGMGEPLDNYKNVVNACRALIDPKRWNMAHKGVTVSTVGIVDKIRKLTLELPQVGLALSLHAPNQAMRSAIVPTAKYFPIEKLIDALDGHMMAYVALGKMREAQKRAKKGLPPIIEKSPSKSTNVSVRTGLSQNNENDPQDTAATTSSFTVEERVKESSRRRAMIEYVMLEGDTTTIQAAHQLGKLCENRQLLVNLIPYNQTDVEDVLRCPSTEHMEVFRNIVSSYGTFCTIRRTMGADIDSACGQLVTLQKQGEASGCNNSISDIEDVVPSMKTVVTQQQQKSLTNRVRQHDPKTTIPTNAIDDDSFYDILIKPLVIATCLSGAAFIASALLFSMNTSTKHHRARLARPILVLVIIENPLRSSHENGEPVSSSSILTCHAIIKKQTEEHVKKEIHLRHSNDVIEIVRGQNARVGSFVALLIGVTPVCGLKFMFSKIYYKSAYLVLLLL